MQWAIAVVNGSVAQWLEQGTHKPKSANDY